MSELVPSEPMAPQAELSLLRLPAWQLAQLIEQLPCQVLFKDCDSRFTACNRKLAEASGFSKEALIGHTDFDLWPSALAERYRRHDLRVMQERRTLVLEEPCLYKGQVIWLETTRFPLFDEAGEVVGVGLFFASQAHKDTQQLNYLRHTWALEAMSHCNQALVQAQDEAQLVQGVCDALVHDDRYPLALIGWEAPNVEVPLILAAVAGPARAFIDQMMQCWKATLTPGPLVHCLGTMQVVYEPDVATNCRQHPCYRLAGRFHLASVLVLPLVRNDGVRGVLAIYADLPHAFGKEEELLFTQLASNLNYGIAARQTQAAYQASLKAQAEQAQEQEKALSDALVALGAVLEQRDPYTAGHQLHVADLAQRIGLELQLPADRLRGLYLSAIVHDLGKIQVPVEILTKPGRLTALEFSLVKQHPEVGYEILKGIAFPWPIAEIIRQHHEYLDGSGYPRGLKGDEILLEARILTVADIVESMSSDRPYRAALGIPEARAEILRMRGTRLDPEVVDACIRVLARGEFVPHLLQIV